jgi:hypothetical protein
LLIWYPTYVTIGLPIEDQIPVRQAMATTSSIRTIVDINTRVHAIMKMIQVRRRCSQQKYDGSLTESSQGPMGDTTAPLMVSLRCSSKRILHFGSNRQQLLLVVLMIVVSCLSCNHRGCSLTTPLIASVAAFTPTHPSHRVTNYHRSSASFSSSLTSRTTTTTTQLRMAWRLIDKFYQLEELEDRDSCRSSVCCLLLLCNRAENVKFHH